MTEPAFHVALLNPEIPQNTGNVGRLCLGIGAVLHLVRPFPFSIDDKAVRRAGLDYWKHVELVVHDDADAFWAWCGDRRVHLFSSHAPRAYTACPYQRGDVLLFGRESVGLPQDWVAARGGYRIPMTGPIRSLNLANAVSVVVYEGLRQIEPGLFA